MRTTQFQQHSLKSLRLTVLLVPLFAAGSISAEVPDPQPPEPPTASSPAPQASSGSQDRLLFPPHWLRGYTDIKYAPPHNEPDLGRCLPFNSASVSSNPFCADFARYVLGGYVEIQPLARTPFRHLFFYAQPNFYFGRNLPQVSYTQSADAIGYENTLGAAFELPKHLELRVERHSVHWFGRYATQLGLGDFGSGGLNGKYATVGLRWYFGGYGHMHP
jgi:hypothetical protein